MVLGFGFRVWGSKCGSRGLGFSVWGRGGVDDSL